MGTKGTGQISMGELGATHYHLQYCNRQTDALFNTPLSIMTPVELSDNTSSLLGTVFREVDS